jgi:hypothetical protein
MKKRKREKLPKFSCAICKQKLDHLSVFWNVREWNSPIATLRGHICGACLPNENKNFGVPRRMVVEDEFEWGLLQVKLKQQRKVSKRGASSGQST